MAAGVVFLFIGVALTARYFVRPLAGAVGWPVQKRVRAAGPARARERDAQPGRTATTAAALMVGLGLVVFVAVFAQSLKSSFTDSIDRLIASEIIITERNFNPLPDGVERRRAPTTPGVAVAAVDPLRRHPRRQQDDRRLRRRDERRRPARDRRRSTTPTGWTARQRGLVAAERRHHRDRGAVREGARPRRSATRSASAARAADRATLRVLAIYKDPRADDRFAVTERGLRRLSTLRDPVIVLADVDAGRRRRAGPGRDRAARSRATRPRASSRTPSTSRRSRTSSTSSSRCCTRCWR